uniref:Uncharacterized protein n=1 Tax=Lutzomyia longipalpis TaxID=7200 RepID=A0A1B0CHH0_LUTLO
MENEIDIEITAAAAEKMSLIEELRRVRRLLEVNLEHLDTANLMETTKKASKKKTKQVLHQINTFKN